MLVNYLFNDNFVKFVFELENVEFLSLFEDNEVYFYNIIVLVIRVVVRNILVFL